MAQYHPDDPRDPNAAYYNAEAYPYLDGQHPDDAYHDTLYPPYGPGAPYNEFVNPHLFVLPF